MSAEPKEVAVITKAEVQAQKAEQKSLVRRFADRYGVDHDKLLVTLKNTAFKQRQGEVSNEQMMALLVVADQYHLNPFTREIYAYPDKNNGIVPVVGVDGWSRIINEHPNFDGMEFRQSETIVTPDMGKPCPEWIECVMHRKDRAHPTSIPEHIDEVYRPPFMRNGEAIAGPWQTHTKRMLRHKAVIQCARLAFGFVGIFDPDEADRIIEAQGEIDVTPQKPTLQLDESGKPEFVNHDGTPHVPGKKISPKKMRELVEAVEAALKAKDGPALLKAISGLDSDGQLQLWGNLRSWDRTAYRELEAKARKADAGMQLDSWSISLLRECENEDALQKAFKAVVDAYEANGVTEVPESVLLVCDEMRMSMGAA